MMPKHCLHIVLCSLGLPVILYCDLRNKGWGGINKSISKILYTSSRNEQYSSSPLQVIFSLLEGGSSTFHDLEF